MHIAPVETVQRSQAAPYKAGRISEDIVNTNIVGREDTGELEAQISRLLAMLGMFRLISMNALSAS